MAPPRATRPKNPKLFNAPHQNKPLAIPVPTFKIKAMKALLHTLALLLLATAVTVVAHADPGNPFPENVGTYNYSTFSASTGEGIILLRNTKRDLLIIQNTGTGNVLLKPGSIASSTLYDGIILGAFSTFMPIPAMVDQWQAKAWTGTVTLTIIEGIK